MPPVLSRRLIALLVLVLGTALGRSDALARDTEKAWEFGGYAMVSRFAESSNIDPGFGFGARGGYHFKAIHELEASLDLVTADDKALQGIEYDVTKFSVDYVRLFLIKGHEKMTPLASFGLGLVNVDDGTDSTSSTAYRVGGGFKYFFTPRVGFRFDVKVYRWHGDGDVLGRDPFFSMDSTFAVTFLAGGAK